MGKASFRKEGRYGTLLRGRGWEHFGWRRDHFRGWGELEREVQLCSTTRERLQPKTCWAALLPKVYHMGELMLDKGMGKELEEPWQMINLQVIRNSGIHTISGK